MLHYLIQINLNIPHCIELNFRHRVEMALLKFCGDVTILCADSVEFSLGFKNAFYHISGL